MKFSFTEQVDMLLIYGKAQQNSIRAQYYTLNGIQIGCIFHIICFNEFVKKLRETGSLTTRKFERRKRVCLEDNEINLQQ